MYRQDYAAREVSTDVLKDAAADFIVTNTAAASQSPSPPTTFIEHDSPSDSTQSDHGLSMADSWTGGGEVHGGADSPLSSTLSVVETLSSEVSGLLDRLDDLRVSNESVAGCWEVRAPVVLFPLDPAFPCRTRGSSLAIKVKRCKFCVLIFRSSLDLGAENFWLLLFPYITPYEEDCYSSSHAPLHAI